MPTPFANPISAAMQAIADALEPVAGVPDVTFVPSVGDTAITVLSYFDDVPREVKPPYVAVGPAGFIPQRYSCGDGLSVVVRLRLYVYSVAAGREEAWNIAWAAMNGLDQFSRTKAALPAMTLPAGWAFEAFPQVTQTGDVINPIDPKCVFFDLDMQIAPVT
jgi:hypothetical protein